MPGDALCKLMANAAVASVLKKVAGLRVARLNERVVNWTPTCYLEDTQFKIDVPQNIEYFAPCAAVHVVRFALFSC